MSENRTSPKQYGPTVPSKRKNENDNTSGGRAPETDSTSSKRARVIGPALPPPDARPASAGSQSDESDDDSDDDYGPSLPPPTSSSTQKVQPQDDVSNNADNPSAYPVAAPSAKRDEWMLRPPDQLDFSSRMDPTKLKNRKFNTGNSVRPSAAKSGGVSTWTETTEEKRKRLANEVMGVQAPATALDESKPSSHEHAETLSKQVREYNEKNRTKSLYSSHKPNPTAEEQDDPSARAFDKEKDIRAPSKINNAKRRELLNKASDFGSRFAGGNFL